MGKAEKKQEACSVEPQKKEAESIFPDAAQKDLFLFVLLFWSSLCAKKARKCDQWTPGRLRSIGQLLRWNGFQKNRKLTAA